MRTSLAISLLFICCNLQAQNNESERKYHYGIHLGSSFNTLIGEFLINPMITESNYKHQYEFGPKLYIGQWGGKGTRFGIEVNYKYYPNSKATPFSSFLLLNSELYINKRSVTYPDYTSIPNEGHLVTQNMLTRTAAMHIGYGIEWRFIGQFYLSSDVGFGGFYQILNGERISDEPTLNSEWINDDWGFTSRISISVGWRFR